MSVSVWLCVVLQVFLETVTFMMCMPVAGSIYVFSCIPVFVCFCIAGVSGDSHVYNDHICISMYVTGSQYLCVIASVPEDSHVYIVHTCSLIPVCV